MSYRQVVFLTIFSMLPILAMLNFQGRIRNDVSHIVWPGSLIRSYPCCYPIICVGAQESKASSMINSLRTKTILLHFEQPFTASSKTCFPSHLPCWDASFAASSNKAPFQGPLDINLLASHDLTGHHHPDQLPIIVCMSTTFHEKYRAIDLAVDCADVS